MIVGITAHCTTEGEWGMYSNGLRQNVVFLYQLFAAAGYTPYLVLYGGDPKESLARHGIADERIRRLENMPRMDAMVVLGAETPADDLRRLRDAGCKNILYKCGPYAALSMESLCVRPIRNSHETYRDADCYDELWITPQYEHIYRGWAEIIYRCPSRIVPQVWGPDFMLSMKPYKPTNDPWRFAVMEPNTTVSKTSHHAVLAVEEAFRMRPEIVEYLLITNALKLKDNPHFKSFCGRLELHKTGKLTVEARYTTPFLMGKHADAVVSHCWENNLNYLYYDVLLGSYPLIHNSTWLRDINAGYYFDLFDCQMGGRVILEAKERHDDTIEQYQVNSATLLWSVSPNNPAQWEAHRI